ncbi:MAG: hypothetical protein HKN48_09915 [Flavobacteriaceae bacterium]|nr:hypothetical protein [Flavobacteriaceae bacterium]
MDEVDIIIDSGDEPTANWERPEFQILLLIKRKWRLKVPTDKRMMMLACALNMGVERDLFQIYGYLMTENRLVFILSNDDGIITSFLEEFSRMLWLELELYFDSIGDRISFEEAKPVVDMKEAALNEFFDYKTITDETLFKILTDQDLGKAFNDPTSLFLKDKVKREKYSSILDYQGGESPVRVSVITLMGDE